MRRFLGAIAILLISCTGAYSQGQVLFANRVLASGIDAPIFFIGTLHGPGPAYSAQLLLVGADNSLTPLLPITTFQTAGPGDHAVRDRYLKAQLVDVPVMPGDTATFIVRVWRTSAGSYEKDFDYLRGQSDPVTISVGGSGLLPPSSLNGLRGFTVGFVPEPSTWVLSAVGGAILLMWRMQRC
jgi:hypothetical protein